MKKYLLYLLAIPVFFACSTKKGITDNSNGQKVETAVSKGENAAKNLETKAESVTDTDNSPDLENALLWEITGNGIKETSYLFGTIHIIGKEDFFWPSNTLASLEKAKKTVFEIDFDDMFDMGNMMGMMSKVFMKDGKTLKDLLSDEDYTFVSNEFKELGLPMMMLERMKPMFLTIFAQGDVGMGGADSNMKSYEMELYELAQQADKSVHGLETVDDQIAIFDSIPYTEQATLLVESLKSKDSGSDEMEMLTKMYTTQNITEMVESMSAEDSEYKEFEDIMLNDRNENWIPLMTDYMNESATFFAVGAGHLAGKKGVINLLREKGYTLKPLSIAQD